MIKMILIMLLSAIVAAGTTVAVMMRYSNVVPSYQTVKNDLSIKANQRASLEIVAAGLMHVAESEHPDDTPSSSQGTQEPKYFDYDRLLQDLDQITDTLEKFNHLLTKEINRLKQSDNRGVDAADNNS